MAPDDELIEGCLKGHSNAQELLYIQYGPIMKGVCMRYVKNREIASDVLQDSFVKIFKNLNKFNKEGSLKSWMCRIAVNTSLDYLRKQKKIVFQPINGEEELYIQTEGTENEDDENIISKVLDKGFSKEFLLEILSKLPEKYSTVFNMFFIDEMSHNEIAKVIEINEAMSRKWVYRAKGMVKEHLVKHLDRN